MASPVRSNFARFRETSRGHIMASQAINLRGTVDFFVNNMFNCPTLAESLQDGLPRRLEPHGEQ